MLVCLVFVNLLILVFARSREVVPSKPHRDVFTTQGVVRGYFVPHPPHYTFLGLPYALPPTRHDRFKASKPLPGWDGIFEATHRVKCPQANAGDENCLVINVFMPEHATSLPVLVHVHDGGFQNGWGPYHPPLRLLQKDIVVVTFNYRIGALGFLCLDTHYAPGNAGLKDQVSAIYWIHRNIEKFGGNPLDITLYGIEAGATSIQLLLLSGLTEGLFHKVILESGSALSPSSMAYDPFSVAMDVATKLGYKDNADSNKLVNFLQKIPIKHLTNASYIFLPCVESNINYSQSLLDTDPMETLMQSKFQQVPMLLVYANTDTALFGNNHIYNTVPDFEDLLPSNLVFETKETRHRIAELVKEVYFDNGSKNMVQNYAKYMNDLLIEYPIVKSAFLHGAMSSQPVYLMKFVKNFSSVTTEINNNFVDYIYAKDNNMGYDDERIAKILISFWSNFIHFSDPTPLTTALIPIIWQPVTSGDPDDSIGTVSQLIFDNNPRMSEPSTSQHLLFWNYLYNKFYKSHSQLSKYF